MIFETIEAAGLAHYSYFLGDEAAGAAVVIDPRRDVDVYLDLARYHGIQITHILETHIHADFVSGSRELAAHTHAPIYGGATGDYEFIYEGLADGDSLEIGQFRLQALHAPGHTPEHLCYLVSGGLGAGEPWGLFSGDALFAGEVGRPDLLGDGTEESLARRLYHSLHDTLLKLDDGIILYPAHGEGSACGGRIGERSTSTIGYERHHNHRLQLHDEDAFVRHVLDSLSPAPRYYARIKRINRQGPRALGYMPHLQSLSVAEFQEELNKPETVIIDTREIEAFGGAHIPNALNIPLRESFPVWVGWLLQPEQRILLSLACPDDLEQAQRHFFRLGYNNVLGYLQRGFRSWTEAGLDFEQIPQLSVNRLNRRITDENDALQLLDVRSNEEWADGHIPTARHQYLPYLSEVIESFDPLEAMAVYCGTGFRAGIAASLLKQHNFTHVYNVPGSITAWEAAGYALEEST